jgi:hypothetical protein
MSGYFQLSVFKILALAIGWSTKNDDYSVLHSLPGSLGIISYIWVVLMIVLGIMMTIFYQNKSKHVPAVYLAVYGVVIVVSVLVA